MEQYSFLIGKHEIRAYRWNAENESWGQGYLTTSWNGWWALDGFAIADEWFDVQIPGQPQAIGRGINIRMWDAENDRWSNMWMHTRNSVTTEFHSQMEDGKMVMYQVAPETTTKTRIEFEVFDDGNWTRLSYTEDEDGNLKLPPAALMASSSLARISLARSIHSCWPEVILVRYSYPS